MVLASLLLWTTLTAVACFAALAQAAAGVETAEAFLSQSVRVRPVLRDGHLHDEEGWGLIVGERDNLLFIAVPHHVVAGSGQRGASTAAPAPPMSDRVELRFFHDRAMRAYSGTRLAVMLDRDWADGDLAVVTVRRPEGLRLRTLATVPESMLRPRNPVWLAGRGNQWIVPGQPGEAHGYDVARNRPRLLNLIAPAGTSGAAVVTADGLVGLVVEWDPANQIVLALRAERILGAFREWGLPTQYLDPTARSPTVQPQTPDPGATAPTASGSPRSAPPEVTAPAASAPPRSAPPQTTARGATAPAASAPTASAPPQPPAPTASAPSRPAPATTAAPRAAAAAATRLTERSLGRADAPVAVIVYFSLTSRHYAAFHRDTYPRVKRELIEAGRIRLIFRDFPLDRLALAAHVTARCLPPERYEAFLGALSATQDRWAFAQSADPMNELARLATMAGMSRDEFDMCQRDDALKHHVLDARIQGERDHGAFYSPTFVFNDRTQSGNLSFDSFVLHVAEANHLVGRGPPP
jgi:protein-disulfide isomerase